MVQIINFKKFFSLNEIDNLDKTFPQNSVMIFSFDVSDPFYKDKENSRKVVKKVLAHYLDINAQELSFEKNENGKPSIREDLNHLKLFHNVSHSGDYLVVAVTQGQPVGVDIEKKRPLQYADKIAKKYFNENDLQYILSKSENIDPELFLEIWCQKEAAIKLQGGSFFKDVSSVQTQSLNLQKIEIDPQYFCILALG